MTVTCLSRSPPRSRSRCCPQQPLDSPPPRSIPSARHTTRSAKQTQHALPPSQPRPCFRPRPRSACTRSRCPTPSQSPALPTARPAPARCTCFPNNPQHHPTQPKHTARPYCPLNPYCTSFQHALTTMPLCPTDQETPCTSTPRSICTTLDPHVPIIHLLVPKSAPLTVTLLPPAAP